MLTYPCNMFQEPFPNHNDPTYSYNAIFLSNILHDWDIARCKVLCQKAFDALPRKGSILIHEALFNDNYDGPLEVALFSFHMFSLTSGHQFSFNELKEMLKSCGFSEIGVIHSFGVYSIVHAKKE